VSIEEQRGRRGDRRSIIYTSLEDLSSAIFEDPIREEIIVEVNKDMMDDRSITMDELKDRLQLQNATVKVKGDTLQIKPKKAEQMKRMLSKIPSVHVKGVADIKRVLVTEESGEWVIRTDGSNLSKVLEIPVWIRHEPRQTIFMRSRRLLELRQRETRL